MIEMTKEIRDLPEDTVLGPAGKTACRAVVGSLHFLASQGMGWIAAETSILSSYVNEATPGLVKKLNKLVRAMHQTSRIPIAIRRIQDPVFVTWHDAAWAVRRDSKSQGGFIVGLAERAILVGERSPVSPLLLCTKNVPGWPART